MISISALCIDGKGFRSRVSGVRDYRLSFSCQQPGCRQAVSMSRINSFQTQSLTTIKWPNLGHETSATLPFHTWSSYSMPCLKQPTTKCAVEIRETSWATALFAVVVSSLMMSQRRISCSLATEGFWPRSEWYVYKFGAKTAYPCFVAFIPHLLKFDFDQFKGLLSYWLR